MPRYVAGRPAKVDRTDVLLILLLIGVLVSIYWPMSAPSPEAARFVAN